MKHPDLTAKDRRELARLYREWRRTKEEGMRMERFFRMIGLRKRCLRSQPTLTTLRERPASPPSSGPTTM